MRRGNVGEVWITRTNIGDGWITRSNVGVGRLWRITEVCNNCVSREPIVDVLRGELGCGRRHRPRVASLILWWCKLI